jgi:hypothetical protein
LLELVAKDYPFTRGLSKPRHCSWKREYCGRGLANGHASADTRNSKVSVEYFGMSNPEETLLELKRTQLEEKLREIDERLRSEMRARGFDPAQTDNLALTGPLAKLYLERENLQAELELLPGLKDGGSR